MNLKMIKIAGYIMPFVFCYILANCMDLTKDLLEYCVLIIIFGAEAIRSYYEGLRKGADIVMELINEKR